MLLVLGMLFWSLCRTTGQLCLDENCDQNGRLSGASHYKKIHNDSIILELQQEKQKNKVLELELSRLRGGKKQKRIALMFIGAPRTLTQLGVMTSHVVNVIDALSAGGRDVVDVFFHLTNGTMDGAFSSNTPFGRVRQETFSQEILDRLVNLTSPVEVVLHNDASCSGLDGRIANHSCCADSFPTSHAWRLNFLQFAFVRDAYQSVKRYEKVNNITYDWFVRLRPDVACFEPMPAARSLSTQRFYLITKEREHGMNTNDYLFIVPRRLSHSFFEEQIMTIFESTCPRGISHWPAEGLMFKHWPNLPYQALAFPCVHVLGPTAAACSRMSRRGQSSIPTVYDMDGSTFTRGKSFEAACNEIVQNGYFGYQNHVEGEEWNNIWRR